jgi:hypothetical protein
MERMKYGEERKRAGEYKKESERAIKDREADRERKNIRKCWIDTKGRTKM